MRVQQLPTSGGGGFYSFSLSVGRSVFSGKHYFSAEYKHKLALSFPKAITIWSFAIEVFASVVKGFLI